VNIDPRDFIIGDSFFGALFANTEIFTDSFPLHEATEMSSLRAEIFSFGPPRPNPVRTSFGTKIALYFAFLQSLNIWLVALGVAAVVAEATIFVYGTSSKWAMLYGCSVPIWSALFLKYWERRSASLVFEWEARLLKSDLRWQLHCERQMFQVTGKPTVMCLSKTVQCYLAVTIPLIAGLLLPSTLITVVRLNLEGKLSANSPWHWPAVVNFGQCHSSLGTPLGHALLSGASAIVLYFVNRLYSKYCVAMSKWEGCASEEAFAASLALKRLPFELGTFFLSPLIRAIWGPTAAVLRIDLTGVLLGEFTARMCTEVLWPSFLHSKRQWLSRRNALSTRRPTSALAKRVQTEAELPRIEFFDGHCRHVRYYIVVTCFASVFPMGVVLCVALLWFESKAALYCLTRFRERSPGLRRTSLGVWLEVLCFVSAISVPFNCFLQAHTTGQIAAAFANFAALHSIGAYGIAFTLEQLMREAVRLVSVLVAVVPEKEQRETIRWAEIHKESAGSKRDTWNETLPGSHGKKPGSTRTEALPELSTIG